MCHLHKRKTEDLCGPYRNRLGLTTREVLGFSLRIELILYGFTLFTISRYLMAVNSNEEFDSVHSFPRRSHSACRNHSARPIIRLAEWQACHHAPISAASQRVSLDDNWTGSGNWSFWCILQMCRTETRRSPAKSDARKARGDSSSKKVFAPRSVEQQCRLLL